MGLSCQFFAYAESKKRRAAQSQRAMRNFWWKGKSRSIFTNLGEELCTMYEEWKGGDSQLHRGEPKHRLLLLSFHQLIVFVRSSRHVCASRTQNHITDLASRIKGRKTTQEKGGPGFHISDTRFLHTYWTFYLIDFHDITLRKWYEKSEYEMMWGIEHKKNIRVF